MAHTLRFRLAAALVVGFGLAAPAEALEPRQFAGWWLGIDSTFPRLWEQRAIVPMEELLIIGPDGRTEDRAMNFWAGSARACAETKVCADAPVIASARLESRGRRLRFTRRQPGGNRLDAAGGDKVIRDHAVTATATWTVTLDGDLMTLRAARQAPRYFARVDPGRLRRLRAGMRASSLPPARHWRCFLANATAGDKAFAPLRDAKPTGDKAPASPAALPGYLRVASYAAALNAALTEPTEDDPEAATRRLLGFGTEELLTESFGDIHNPANLADKRNLQARLDAIEYRVVVSAGRHAQARASGADAATDAGPAVHARTPDKTARSDRARSGRPAMAATESRVTTPARPIKLPLAEADLRAFATVLSDPGLNARLFCPP